MKIMSSTINIAIRTGMFMNENNEFNYKHAIRTGIFMNENNEFNYKHCYQDWHTYE